LIDDFATISFHQPNWLPPTVFRWPGLRLLWRPILWKFRPMPVIEARLSHFRPVPAFLTVEMSEENSLKFEHATGISRHFSSKIIANAVFPTF
jgi:hypothetical protein